MFDINMKIQFRVYFEKLIKFVELIVMLDDSVKLVEIKELLVEIVELFDKVMFKEDNILLVCKLFFLIMNSGFQ